MKKLFLPIAVLLLATMHVCAQANIAGTLYASNFAQWTVSQGNNGPYSWSSSSVCTQATSGGVTFRPFTVGTPIRIVDTATPGNTENVTVTAVNINGSGCNIATSTPAHQHFSFYLASATAGLQEAINYSKQSLGTSNPASVVIVTPAWSTAGGTTTMITPNAQGSVAISILDERTSVIVPYTWISTLYVAQPFNASALTSVTLTGDVTASISGPGAGTGAATLATVNGSPGACGDSTHVGRVTVNGKGLTTACTATAILGYTIGANTYAPGANIQALTFSPAAGFPVIMFAGASAGGGFTSGYLDFSANVFQWGAFIIRPDNINPTRVLSVGSSGGSPAFTASSGLSPVFGLCGETTGPSCTDSWNFTYLSTGTNYGHIGPVGSVFTTPWTLGSLVLTNIGTTPSTSPVCPNGTGGILTTSGCATGSSGLSGMTTGQVAIAATASTITSSKALAGSGAGITTGPTSDVVGDITCFTGTAGQIADCGQIPTTLYFHVDNIPTTQNDFVGPLYLVPHAYAFTNATVNSTSGTCTGTPQYSIRDLGTSIVAWGSSTQVATFSSGPGSKFAAAVSFTIAAGHYMGIGFTGGTCSVNYTSDLSLN